MDPQAPKKRGRKPKPKEDKKDEPQPSQPKMKDSKRSHHHSVDDKYTQWKSLVPVLYDWLANHNLVWPSLSCRWGPQLEQATYKNRQRLYLSDDCDTTGGGGTLQIWRMSDLIYRPEDEVLAELDKFKSHVVSCASKP
uniref:FVE-4 variant n=1 Tax=Dimocarpus longan TaxID=128017 RepID=M1R090_9ROSI|nr:FVE-4 variant [Dimocarpus longan]